MEDSAILQTGEAELDLFGDELEAVERIAGEAVTSGIDGAKRTTKEEGEDGRNASEGFGEGWELS